MLTPWLRPVLQALDNKRVLIVAHENITNNYYPGNNRSCLVSNCLFRVGGAACLMSNRRAAPLRPRFVTNVFLSLKRLCPSQSASAAYDYIRVAWLNQTALANTCAARLHADKLKGLLL